MGNNSSAILGLGYNLEKFDILLNSDYRIWYQQRCVLDRHTCCQGVDLFSYPWQDLNANDVGHIMGLECSTNNEPVRVIGLCTYNYLYTGFCINVLLEGAPLAWVVKLVDKTRSDQIPIAFGLFFIVVDVLEFEQFKWCDWALQIMKLVLVLQEFLGIALEVGHRCQCALKRFDV